MRHITAATATTMRRSSANPASVERGERDRGWFLQDSAWDDVTWSIAPTNILTEHDPVRLRWDFLLPSGQRFTDPAYSALLESTKQHLAMLRTQSVITGRALHARSIGFHFNRLRTLVRWMEGEGFRRFCDLDRNAMLQFVGVLRSRQGRGATLAPSTVEAYLQLFVYLYRHRRVIDDSLQVDPFAGETLRDIAGTHARRRLSHTPDIVAVPLIQGAIEFLSTSAIELLRAREVYLERSAYGRRRGLRRTCIDMISRFPLRQIVVSTPRGPCPISSLWVFAHLLDMLYAACFVVIAYLVGARMSEILHLKAGCLHPLAQSAAGSNPPLAMVVGAIFKDEAAYDGRPHQWVAPPAVVHAISVLEALSAPHRKRSSCEYLFWYPEYRLGGAHWRVDHPIRLTIPENGRLNRLLNRFAVWLGLPDVDGHPWELSSHQGRNYVASRATSSVCGSVCRSVENSRTSRASILSAKLHSLVALQAG